MGSLFKEEVIDKIISYIETPMTLYVLIEMHYYEKGTIIGIFKTREEALEAFQRFRYEIDNRLIDISNHHTRKTTRKWVESLRNNGICNLSGDEDYEGDDGYMIRKFKLGEMNPQFC